MSRHDTRVAVLGCGPAGLLAAHAAVMLGHTVDVYSKKQKSFISGAQYVHDPIPVVAEGEPDGELTYIKLGDKRGYATKVYGDPDAPCSWDAFPEGSLPAWSMPDMYNRLWSKYADAIYDTEINDEVMIDICVKYDKVISAVPAKVLCHNLAHRFDAQKVYIYPEAHVEDERDNVIVYNGSNDGHWYRTSKIFGNESTETTRMKQDAWRGLKPLWTNCSCWPGVLRVGRFGQWRKGVLVHHAFQGAHEALMSGAPEQPWCGTPRLVEIERTEEGLCMGRYTEHIESKFGSCIRCGRPC